VFLKLPCLSKEGTVIATLPLEKYCTATLHFYRAHRSPITVTSCDFNWGHKSKAIPLQAWTVPEGSREVEVPRFQDSRHMMVVRLSALRTGPLLPPREYSWYSFLLERLSQPQGHSAAGRIMWMKNSSDTIGNRTCDLPICNAVPQPTAPPRASFNWGYIRSYYSSIALHTARRLLKVIISHWLYRFLGACAKLRKVIIKLLHVCLSLRLHGTTELSLEGFLWNLVFVDFLKVCRENSDFIKIWQE